MSPSSRSVSAHRARHAPTIPDFCKPRRRKEGFSRLNEATLRAKNASAAGCGKLRIAVFLDNAKSRVRFVKRTDIDQNVRDVAVGDGVKPVGFSRLTRPL